MIIQFVQRLLPERFDESGYRRTIRRRRSGPRAACRSSRHWGIGLSALVLFSRQLRADDIAVDLPEGVRAVWDVGKAHHEKTPTRERICLNGLWRWQPAAAKLDQVPGRSWGFFKVPGCWPGITDYMQKDSQTLHAHPGWKDMKPGRVTAVWYEREMTILSNWSGRRISLHVEYVNAYAMVLVTGVK